MLWLHSGVMRHTDECHDISSSLDTDVQRLWYHCRQQFSLRSHSPDRVPDPVLGWLKAEERNIKFNLWLNEVKFCFPESYRKRQRATQRNRMRLSSSCRMVTNFWLSNDRRYTFYNKEFHRVAVDVKKTVIITFAFYSNSNWTIECVICSKFACFH